MNKWLLAVIAALLLVLLVRQLIHPAASEATPVESSVAAPAQAETEAVIAETGAEQIAEKTEEESSNHISLLLKKHTQSQSAADDGQLNPALSADEAVANQAFDSFRQSVETSLTGDTETMDRLLEDAFGCQRATLVTIQDVENEIEFMRQRFEQANRNAGRDNYQEVLERSKARIQGEQQHCAWRHAADFTAFRNQLAQRADAGDVIARFIYAMLLKPSPLESDWLIRMEEWANNALRFSIANVEQNQTMGYLAQALSYSFGQYTYSDPRSSGVWYYLLLNCPHGGPVPTDYMNSVLANQRLEFLSPTTLILGQQMVDQLCPSLDEL